MSSGFITESEIAEAKKKRQEEWEKVRKADDPLEAPEPTYDTRSLYERLQEQKQKRELEYEEAHKLKNMIKGLDDDEIEFLDLVDKTKLAVDRKKMIEEEHELNDYRNRVANLQEQNIEKKLQSEVTAAKPKVQFNNRISQMKLLKGAVVTKSPATKRKHSDSESTSLIKTNEKSDEYEETSTLKKTKHEEIKEKSSHEKESSKDKKNNNTVSNTSRKRKYDAIVSKETENSSYKGPQNAVMKCIGILPGMGYYSHSSSDESSDSENDCKIIKLADLIQKRPKEKEDKQQQ